MSEMHWPADSIARRKTADLVPYARNSRTHSDEQIEQIAASMLAFGVTIPLLVDENGTIIAGHGRALAAELNASRGHAQFDELPVMTAVGWSDDQKSAYVILDNKVALNAGWDKDVLALEIQSLMEADFETELLGFSNDELEQLLPSEVGDLDPGMNDDFQPDDAGETSSGTSNNVMKFAGMSVPMSEDEAERLKSCLEAYISARGVTYGFVAYLLDHADFNVEPRR